jgi:hypothetical protein
MGGILRAGIWSVVTSISLFATIVLWLGDASIDSFATLCEAYMGIEPHFDLWNYFFCTRLWGGVGAVWTSWSDPGQESIHTSAFQCPTLWSGGTAPCVHGWPPCSSTQIGVRCGSAIHLQAATPAQHRLIATTRRAGGRGPPADLRQLPRPTTPTMGDDNVDVSGAKLPRPFLLRRVGRYGDQHLDPRDPCLWGQSEFRP